MGLDAFECLQRSVQLSRDTAGAFDITAGAMIDCWLNKDKTIRSPTSDEIADAMRRTGSNLIELDQDEHTATPLVDGLRIDLGGIGKGYAAEKMTAIFDEWGIETAFIYAGKSSARAIGSPPGMAGWPVTLRDPRNRDDVLARIHLRDISMGASGVEKGRHIIDTRQGRPVEGRLAAWSLAADATAADALSTAFMVMTPQEVDDYCTRHSEAAALIIIDKTGADGTDTLKYGRWPR
jgi:thiamine biosynthesis lipoprotein